MIDRNSTFVIQVLKHLNGDLKSNRQLTKISESFNTDDVHKFLSTYQLLKQYIIENTNEIVFKRIETMLIETNKIPSKVNEYDLTKASEFYRAMEDEIIREMVSGASFGGALSGAGTNQAINSTGLAGIDPMLNQKRKKKIKVLTRNL
jgi:hypothetical protein